MFVNDCNYKYMYNYSFIIPHKNRPNLLSRCINSIPIRNDIQIIVVDDNSVEDKKPCINRSDVEVVLLDAKNSKGAGHARNVGMARAKGKWLLFADADDYYNNDFIKILDVYVLNSFDVLYFNFEHKDGKTGKNLPPLLFQKYFYEYDESQESKDQIKFHHNVPWTKMVSSQYVKRNNIHFEESPNGNDIMFSMMVGYYTNNIYVEKRGLYVYLHNEDSILTSKVTVKSEMCRLKHNIQLNYFYSYIGHPEWKQSIIKKILSKVVRLGFPFLFAFIKQIREIHSARKNYLFS